MYKYDDYDQAIVDERVEQFRDQTRRFISGDLSDDEFGLPRESAVKIASKVYLFTKP